MIIWSLEQDLTLDKISEMVLLVIYVSVVIFFFGNDKEVGRKSLILM